MQTSMDSPILKKTEKIPYICEAIITHNENTAFHTRYHAPADICFHICRRLVQFRQTIAVWDDPGRNRIEPGFLLSYLPVHFS
jgi:hypothetical protein